MLDLMEWHLQVQLRSELPGNAQWAFKDFGTPLRPENPIPYVNQKGLVDRAARPKDVYYLFQSYLASAPMCHIESPTWPLRAGPPDLPQRVRVYSNCPRVTLFVNGATAGERRRDGTAFPAAGLVWHVCLRAGTNELRAVGIAADGSEVVDALTQDYLIAAPGPPAMFHVWTRSETTPSGEQGMCVTVQLTDAARVPIVDDRRRVTFALDGDGGLCDRLGITGGSRVIELANGCASMIVIPPPDGIATLTVTADGITPIAVPVPSVALAVAEQEPLATMGEA